MSCVFKLYKETTLVLRPVFFRYKNSLIIQVLCSYCIRTYYLSLDPVIILFYYICVLLLLLFYYR